MEDNMSLIEFENENDYSAIIKVVGVGGGGSNAVNSMVADNIRGVEFIIANTDVQSLDKSECPGKVQIGAELTRGLGAGSNPETGRNAAEESENIIRDMLGGSDMVFITAGMGGGTGTGAAPVISRIAKETGALTVGVVTKPFPFEGKRRMKQAEEGIAELKKVVDTLIVIPNQKLLSYVGQQTSFKEAFSMVDDILKQAVCSISDLIVIPGLINLDFADVKCIMGSMGKALMGSGTAAGENRAVEAAQKAISSPLLDEATVDGARGILINITGGENLTLMEINEASEMIQKNAHEDAHIIFGSVIDQQMEDEMRVTVIATGFDQATASPIEERPKLRKVVGGNPQIESDDSASSFKHLKTLASSIKDENQDSGNLNANFDIPTFLRKHAD
jgi:cell division protein FtsZ